MQMEQYVLGNDVHLKIDKQSLNIVDTLDCGQCFRFSVVGDNVVSGVAFDKLLQVSQTADEIVFHNTTKQDFNALWTPFFALDVDYDGIKKSLEFDETLRKAIGFAGGIRILRQANFEALCSFIISQNNNIPRIKGTIKRLCERFGDKLDVSGEFGFPSASTLSGIEKGDLADLSLGYRDDYIVDCIKKINSGALDLSAIATMDIVQAREALRTVKGVGPKVAECALLFGFHRLEAFPIDTWIKKVLATYYPNGFPQQASTHAGVAQQYLFHYMRNI